MIPCKWVWHETDWHSNAKNAVRRGYFFGLDSMDRAVLFADVGDSNGDLRHCSVPMRCVRLMRTRIPLFDAPTEELKYVEYDNQPTIASGVYERSAGKWK